MRNDRAIVIILTALLSFISPMVYAADEVFDTQGATLHIDKGIAYLKAKNYNAAIKEFEASAEIAPRGRTLLLFGIYILPEEQDRGRRYPEKILGELRQSL